MEKIPAFQHLAGSRNSSAIPHLEKQLTWHLVATIVPTEQPRQSKSYHSAGLPFPFKSWWAHFSSPQPWQKSLPPPPSCRQYLGSFLCLNEATQVSVSLLCSLSASAWLMLAELHETLTPEFITPGLRDSLRAIVSGWLQTQACTSLPLHSSHQVLPYKYSW